jgi:hypothetical protein
VHEVSGGTLSGSVDSLLVVYSDGTARLSSALGGSGNGSSQTAFVGAAARVLQRELVAAGALDQCDQETFVSDTPLSTLTVFGGRSLARSSSFSWFSADSPRLAAIESLLAAFAAAHFDAPPGGSGS